MTIIYQHPMKLIQTSFNVSPEIKVSKSLKYEKQESAPIKTLVQFNPKTNTIEAQGLSSQLPQLILAHKDPEEAAKLSKNSISKALKDSFDFNVEKNHEILQKHIDSGMVKKSDEKSTPQIMSKATTMKMPHIGDESSFMQKKDLDKIMQELNKQKTLSDMAFDYYLTKLNHESKVYHMGIKLAPNISSENNTTIIKKMATFNSKNNTIEYANPLKNFFTKLRCFLTRKDFATAVNNSFNEAIELGMAYVQRGAFDMSANFQIEIPGTIGKQRRIHLQNPVVGYPNKQTIAANIHTVNTFTDEYTFETINRIRNKIKSTLDKTLESDVQYDPMYEERASLVRTLPRPQEEPRESFKTTPYQTEKTEKPEIKTPSQPTYTKKTKKHFRKFPDFLRSIPSKLSRKKTKTVAEGLSSKKPSKDSKISSHDTPPDTPKGIVTPRSLRKKSSNIYSSQKSISTPYGSQEDLYGSQSSIYSTPFGSQEDLYGSQSSIYNTPVGSQERLSGVDSTENLDPLAQTSSNPAIINPLAPFDEQEHKKQAIEKLGDSELAKILSTESVEPDLSQFFHIFSPGDATPTTQQGKATKSEKEEKSKNPTSPTSKIVLEEEPEPLSDIKTIPGQYKEQESLARLETIPEEEPEPLSDIKTMSDEDEEFITPTSTLKKQDITPQQPKKKRGLKGKIKGGVHFLRKRADDMASGVQKGTTPLDAVTKGFKNVKTKGGKKL